MELSKFSDQLYIPTLSNLLYVKNNLFIFFPLFSFYPFFDTEKNSERIYFVITISDSL